MGYRLLEESNFTNGVIKEIPPWLLPPGTLADASNMIFDEPGVARQRGPSVSLSSPQTTAFGGPLGFVYAADGPLLIEELYAISPKSAAITLVNKTTGGTTTIITPGASVSPQRPVRHFGFLIFPAQIITTGARDGFIVAGQVNTTTFTSTVAQTITANTTQITLVTDATTNIKVGSIVDFTTTAGDHYTGRVTQINSASVFSVWPSPLFAGTVNAAVMTTTPTKTSAGGVCGCSFQNRLLYGGTSELTGGGIGAIMDRRVYYSPLPTERVLQGGSTTIFSNGASFAYMDGWPLLNYFDVPGADPIVSLEPVSDNELLILTQQGVVVLRGTLATQTTTSAPGITFDISPLNTNAGCLADLSVVRTPHGIVWASSEGIMLYTGGGRTPIDLTRGKYHTAWHNLVANANFVIHGAFYARNHYVISGLYSLGAWALAFNLDNETWAPLTGVGTDNFNAAARPSNPAQIYAHRWWDASGAAPTQTGGSVIRVENLFAPDVPGTTTKVDADGSAVAWSATSRTITDDQQLERILRRLSVRADLWALGTFATVAVGARLDSGDTNGALSTAVGSISSTMALNISGQSNATPIVITTAAAHGLQSEDWVDIHGATPNTAANGRWRITVISSTTFSLNGSSGNGASSATGTMKRITEQEFVCSAVDIGQGHYVKIDSAGNCARFRLHGLRMGAMEMNRGLGRG